MDNGIERELTLDEVGAQENANASQNNKYEYKREDSENGFITDTNDIEEFIRQQKIDIYKNTLLGDYSATGEYYLSDEITNELVRAHKVVTKQYENYIFAQSIKPIGEFGVAKFFVTVSKLDDGLIATLTFVEPIYKQNNLLTNTQALQIASFADKGGEKFYYDMKKEFNIVDDDFVVPNDEDNFENALKRKKYREKVWAQSQREINEAEKTLFEKRIKVLDKLNNGKNKYAKELRELLDAELVNKGKLFENDPNEYLYLNDMFNSCMEMLQGKYPEDEKVFNQLVNNASKTASLFQEQAFNKAKVALANEASKSVPSFGANNKFNEKTKSDNDNTKEQIVSSKEKIKSDFEIQNFNGVGGSKKYDFNGIVDGLKKPQEKTATKKSPTKDDYGMEM